MDPINIKERVVKIAKELPFSQEKFYRMIGMTSANFRGKARQTPLNSNAIESILMQFPFVDIYWLVLGENAEKYQRESPNDFSCKEKDEIIRMLKGQIEDLKADKEDLREMLRLSRK